MKADAFTTPLQALSAIGGYFSGVAQHLSWVAVGRAQFAKIPDSLGSFFGPLFFYWAAGLISHAAVRGLSLPAVIVGLCLHLVLLSVIFERPARSSSMLVVAICVSAITDIARILLDLAGVPAVGSLWLATALEIGLLVANYRHFLKMPFNMQARGYKRRLG